MSLVHEVLELHFEAQESARISQIQRRLIQNAGLGVVTDTGAPHISLSSSTGVSVTTRMAQIREYCSSHRACELTLAFLGCFCGEKLTVFLGVTPTAELIQLHTELHSLLRVDGITQFDFITPSKFVPHCTLITGLSRPEAELTLTAATALPLPLHVKAAALKLVRYESPSVGNAPAWHVIETLSFAG